jgi:hypothetical protein
LIGPGLLTDHDVKKGTSVATASDYVNQSIYENLNPSSPPKTYAPPPGPSGATEFLFHTLAMLWELRAGKILNKSIHPVQFTRCVHIRQDLSVVIL